MVLPPLVVESTVWTNVESLLWGWCLGECIANVGAKQEEVFGSSHSVEESGACLIDAIGVDLVQHLDQAGSAGAITNTACLFPAIERLNIVRPHKVKHCVLLVASSRFPKATLIRVLIKLEVF
jgi:hypothetical protein